MPAQSHTFHLCRVSFKSTLEEFLLVDLTEKEDMC